VKADQYAFVARGVHMPTQGGRVGAQQPGALCGFDAISLAPRKTPSKEPWHPRPGTCPRQADHHVLGDRQNSPAFFPVWLLL